MEVVSRGYGRGPWASAWSGGLRAARGLVFIVAGLGSLADFQQLISWGGGLPTPTDPLRTLKALSSAPLHGIEALGLWEETPTRALRAALVGGFGLSLGFRAGGRGGAPMALMLRAAMRGVVWGLLLQLAAHLRVRALLGLVIWVGAGTAKVALLGAALAALLLGLREVWGLRHSPLRAAVGLTTAQRPGGDALRPLGERALSAAAAVAVAALVGLIGGLLAPLGGVISAVGQGYASIWGGGVH